MLYSVALTAFLWPKGAQASHFWSSVDFLSIKICTEKCFLLHHTHTHTLYPQLLLCMCVCLCTEELHSNLDSTGARTSKKSAKMRKKSTLEFYSSCIALNVSTHTAVSPLTLTSASLQSITKTQDLRDASFFLVSRWTLRNLLSPFTCARAASCSCLHHAGCPWLADQAQSFFQIHPQLVDRNLLASKSKVSDGKENHRSI